MTRDEYIEECRDLVDALDEHVTAEDAARTLRELADRVEAEGLNSNECPICGDEVTPFEGVRVPSDGSTVHHECVSETHDSGATS